MEEGRQGRLEKMKEHQLLHCMHSACPHLSTSSRTLRSICADVASDHFFLFKSPRHCSACKLSFEDDEITAGATALINNKADMELFDYSDKSLQSRKGKAPWRHHASTKPNALRQYHSHATKILREVNKCLRDHSVITDPEIMCGREGFRVYHRRLENWNKTDQSPSGFSLESQPRMLPESLALFNVF